MKQRLNIVPLTLAQFQKYFVAMFEADCASPENVRLVLDECTGGRDDFDAPSWKEHIDSVISKNARKFC